MSMSDFLENKVLDGTVGNVTYTAPGNIYMALYSVAPGEAGGGTELVGNGYSRQLVPFSTAAANGQIQNTGNVAFTATGNAWSVQGAALTDASTSGNILYLSTQSRNVTAGASLTYLTGKITLIIN